MKVLNYFSQNLKKLAERYSQKKIAEDTKVSPASINNYINKDSEPSIYFLMQLKNAYGINIDDFLFKPLSTNYKDESLPEGYERFIGNYMIYHYDTSAYKGRVSNYAKNTLNYGVISIYLDPINGLRAQTIFISNRSQAEKMLSEINSFKNTEELLEFYENNGKYKYDGEFSFSNSQLFLSLVNREKNDRSLIILNNPPSIKNYIGGMGTVNTVSRGREHMPCIQYILITREILSIPDGEIYNLLSLNEPDINLAIETEELIKLFKTLYGDNELANNLTEENKKKLIEESVNNMMGVSLEANVFRFAKISSIDDDKYYRIIKRNKNV